MRPFTPILALLFAAALAFAGSAVGQASPAPQVKEHLDKIVLENEHVTVWFQGKKPMLKVFPTGNETAAYTYKFHQVVEYRDLDGNGIPGPQEIVATLNLEKASSYRIEKIEVDGAAILNLTLVANVKLAGGILPENVSLPADRQASITLLFTLRDEAATLEVGDVNVTVPESSVKYDFIVTQWPFVDASANRLALDLRVDGELTPVEVDGVEGASVATNGTELGVVGWLDTAVGNTTAGEEVEVPVKTATETLAAEGNASVQTRIVHTYDAPDLRTLVHDPTIGVVAASMLGENTVDGLQETLNTVPAPGALLGVAAVGTAALFLARRR